MNFFIIFSFLFLIASIGFLITNIITVSKKKKSKGYGITSLVLNLVIPIFTLSSFTAFASVSSSESGMGMSVSLIPLIIVLVLSIANVVLSCIILPSGKSNTQRAFNGNQNSNNNSTTEKTENGVSENYTLTTEEECKKAYKTSTRRKLDIWMIVCWSITGVFGLGAIISCMFNTTAGCIIMFFAIGCFLASLSLTNARKVYCSCCGSEGIIDESELLSTKTTVQVKETNVRKLSDNSYEYQTELKPTTTNIHRHELHCPCCGNKWSATMRSSRNTWK